jgi:hypothetical protein
VGSDFRRAIPIEGGIGTVVGLAGGGEEMRGAQGNRPCLGLPG